MLPCNVTIEEQADGTSLARIANPVMMMTAGELGKNPALVEVAEAAFAKLDRVANSLR
jgi:uncharacterized protein (DUF302 family)